MDRLLDKYKSDDAQSLKRLVLMRVFIARFCDEIHVRIYRSGTEEEYDELSQMLEDIASYQRDVVAVLNQEKKEKKRKEKKKNWKIRKMLR